MRAREIHQFTASAKTSAPPTEKAVVSLLHKHIEQISKTSALAVVALVQKDYIPIRRHKQEAD